MTRKSPIVTVPSSGTVTKSWMDAKAEPGNNEALSAWIMPQRTAPQPTVGQLKRG